jgi:hypothetical protein
MAPIGREIPPRPSPTPFISPRHSDPQQEILMNVRAAILAAFLLSAASLGARPKVDVIVMSNGDRITGEIKSLNGGVLRVDLDYVDGTVALQWMKVARVESPQLFIVGTQDGSSYTGTLLSSADEKNKIQVADLLHSAVTIAQADVVRIDETADSFVHRLNGEISLGLVYSKGNNSTQNTFGSEVEYRRERWGLAAAFNSNLSSSSGANTATRNQLDLTGSRLLPWKNYFYGGLGSFLQSSVQDIHLQTTVGGGIGRYFKNTNRTRVSVLAGLAWQSVSYQESALAIPTEESAAGLVATDVRVFVFKRTNLSVRAYLVPSISENGRVRFNTNASYYLKLFRNWSWNLSFYGNWDTRPPANFSGSDYGYSVGMKWTFGYR